MNIISRAEWGASSRSLPGTSMRLPAREVFIHHSVTPMSGEPATDMRLIEQIGLQRFGQFPYSYVIHPRDGEILEGCGLRRGAHTVRRNSTAFGICWAGNYEDRLPKLQQINSTRQLVAWLRDAGHLEADAPMLGHRDAPDPKRRGKTIRTACPGRRLYNILPELRTPWIEEETVPPMYDPPIGPIAAVWQAETGNVVAAASPDGDVYAWGCEWAGNVRGKPYWGDRKVARIGPPQRPGGIYTITATTAETYTLPDGMD